MHEKTAAVSFWLSNPATGIEEPINLDDYLSKHQQRRMAEDPSMIRQFVAHLMSLNDDTSTTPPTINARASISLNGKEHQPLLIDSWQFKKVKK